MQTPSHIAERPFRTFNGWIMLILTLLFACAASYVVLHMATASAHVLSPGGNVVEGLEESVYSVPATFAVAIGSVILFFFTLTGLYINDPLKVTIITLAGRYKGIDDIEGFRWTWPWYGCTKVSKRLINMNIQSIRVNDKLGNPIDIGAVVVCRIADAAKSTFLVDDVYRFVQNQAEVALRNLASESYYDSFEIKDTNEDPTARKAEPARTLIENREQAGEEAARLMEQMIGDIGVDIRSVNITHLSYAPEIAGAMLRRQAASAVLAARKIIVEGAVEIVNDAVSKLPHLSEDDDRKGAIAANLLTVMIGEQGATPVINVGDVRG